MEPCHWEPPPPPHLPQRDAIVRIISIAISICIYIYIYFYLYMCIYIYIERDVSGYYEGVPAPRRFVDSKLWLPQRDEGASLRAARGDWYAQSIYIYIYIYIDR